MLLFPFKSGMEYWFQ